LTIRGGSGKVSVVNEISPEEGTTVNETKRCEECGSEMHPADLRDFCSDNCERRSQSDD
jgi:hypothetical protein